MNIRRRRDAGFTLIEIMLTVALTALVVGMGFGLLTAAQQIGQIQQEQSAASRDGWVFLYRLSRELREAIPPSQLGGEAEWSGAHASAKLLDTISTAGWPAVALQNFRESKESQWPVSNDTIRFCTLRVVSPGQPPTPGMIEYSLERDPKKNVVNIVRRAAPAGASLDKAETVVYGPSAPDSSFGFVSLGFQYLDAQGQWRPEWKDTKTMPCAVRISVSTLVRPSRRIKAPVVNQYSTLVYLATGSRIPQ
jgi:prepilin-type N-terminal cleavage/methylation domain-containing protein